MGRVGYEVKGAVAWLTMDDGKVNALSLQMQRELHDGLDRAEGDASVVVLTGRPGVFSAGFDLGTLRSGGPDAHAMVRGGFELARRLLCSPLPVVVACSGHAIAMGSFLLLAADHRIGAAGPYRIVANEVAIGLTLPHAATELLRHRLAPTAFVRAAALSEVFSPEAAVPAGFLDGVVEPGALAATTAEVAASFAVLDGTAYAATKARVHEPLAAALAHAIGQDERELVALG